MYILNNASAIKKISVDEFSDLTFENHCEQIRFSERNVVIQ